MLKIAHRGASGTRPELTRAAFARALQIGVDMIELDVQLTRDRRLVVVHDRELGRTLPGSGAVRDRTLAELQTLDAGSWFGPEYRGEAPLSLEEVCDLAEGQADLNVEIKSPEEDWEATARVLVPLLREKKRLSGTVISCFQPGALACVRAVEPAARLGILWQNTDLDAAFAAAREVGATTFHPHWSLAGKSTVDDAHRRGLQVLVWTVNDVAAMRRLAGNGVDGIMTDFPERFAELD